MLKEVARYKGNVRWLTVLKWWVIFLNIVAKNG